MCREKYEMVLFKVASLMTVFGALRIREAAASRKNDKARLALQWQDVKVEDGKVQIFIR